MLDLAIVSIIAAIMPRERTDVPAATTTLDLRTNPDNIAIINAVLQGQHQINLYEGPFPTPFNALKYAIVRQGNQAGFIALLRPQDAFDEKFKGGLGQKEDLEVLFRRYPESELVNDNRVLVVKKGEETVGTIGRTNEGLVIVQMNHLLEPGKPVNSLSTGVTNFNLLLARYVRSVWAGDPETQNLQFAIDLNLNQIPDEALPFYFSTPEVVERLTAEHPRKVAFSEIGGFPSVQAEFQALIVDATNPEISRMHGTKPFSNKFILLSGAEGVGKTLWVKALDTALREKFADLKHYRLPLSDLILKYGAQTANIVNTVFNIARENEKKGVPTIIHIDGLEQLAPASARANAEGMINITSSADIGYAAQVLNPITKVLGEFGHEVGSNSKHVIVIGESQIAREYLPEQAARTFRRAFNLVPTIDDLRSSFEVQIAITRSFANGTSEPIHPEVDEHLDLLAQEAAGLTSRDIQQALLGAANAKKANYDGEKFEPITIADIRAQLMILRLSRGIDGYPIKRPIGFPLPVKKT